MKVVLFCGGLGLRLREYSDSMPKPMARIGYRPVLWHVMRYYAHYGFKDFILCLGYRADVIKQYFLQYDECLSNDFTLSSGAREIRLANTDIHDWNITFVDTGLNANIGQRLRAVRPYLEGEEFFLANYSDNLSDVPLDRQIADFQQHRPTALFLMVQPPYSFHVVKTDKADHVTDIRDAASAGIWINGGFFVLASSIFDYLHEGEELVVEPFQRLVQERKLMAYRYEGFWACLDTFKDKQQLDELYAHGQAPWEVWKNGQVHSLETGR